MLAASGALLVSAPAALAAPPDHPAPASAPYLGRWNYDQPDRDSGRNVALLSCPDSRPDCVDPNPSGGALAVPQVGDIVFTEGADGDVVGRTNVGCNWHFEARSARRLELPGTSQTCFNEIQRVSYTITEWTVTVRGHHVDERIAALSHRHDGNYDFTLVNGSRSRVPEAAERPVSPRLFGGTWEYAPADHQTQVNIARTHETGPDGEQAGQREQTGTVRYTPGRDGTVIAQTSDGCRWTLVARRNTAHLAPDEQTCQLPGGASVTLTTWTISSDGNRQFALMRGVETDGTRTTDVLLGMGELDRTGSRR